MAGYHPLNPNHLLITRHDEAEFEVIELPLSEHLKQIVIPILEQYPTAPLDVRYNYDTPASALRKLAGIIEAMR